ncbi:MAG: hypothetical protein R3C61_13790 [Bacteroidia bacterium]
MEDENQLTPQELEIFRDLDFMPLKARVWKKMESILGQLQPEIKTHLTSQPALPEVIRQSVGKISRGENYQSYPYRVLDYPNVFEGDNFLLFRTVILWGRPVGFHLILSGNWKHQLENTLLNGAPTLPAGFLLSAQSNPWIWEPQPDMQHEVSTAPADLLKKTLRDRAFLKLSVYLPVEAYTDIPRVGLQTWKTLESLFFPQQ